MQSGPSDDAGGGPAVRWSVGKLWVVLCVGRSILWMAVVADRRCEDHYTCPSNGHTTTVGSGSDTREHPAGNAPFDPVVVAAKPQVRAGDGPGGTAGAAATTGSRPACRSPDGPVADPAWTGSSDGASAQSVAPGATGAAPGLWTELSTGAGPKAARAAVRRRAVSTGRPSSAMPIAVVTARPRSQPRDVARL